MHILFDSETATFKKAVISVKYFNIGVSRTGQTSVTQAMKRLGFSAVRYPHNMGRIDKSDFSSDITVTAFFLEGRLQKRYPDAKYIYTYRDPDNWIESADKFWKKWPPGKQKNNYLRRISNWCHITCYGIPTYNREMYYEKFIKHDIFVREYFKDKPGKLLIMNLFDGDGWDKLCKFVGIDNIPNEPFIHVNSFQERLENNGKVNY